VKGPPPDVAPPLHPLVDPSPAEQTIMRLVKRAKLFVFLRQHRHELFDDAFQQEPGTIYKDSPFGPSPGACFGPWSPLAGQCLTFVITRAEPGNGP